MLAKIVENFADEVWNRKNMAVIDSVIHRDALLHSTIGDFHGPNDMKQIVTVWLKAFPDLVVTNINSISESDKVVLQWQAKGTHKGEFKGVSPTGNPVSYSGVTIYRLKDKKIIEYWAYLDMLTLLNQIKGNPRCKS